jgi:polar amino acid transport system substrate-binding protein
MYHVQQGEEPMRSSKKAALAIAVVASTVMVACGSDDSDSGSDTTDASPDATAGTTASDDPLAPYLENGLRVGFVGEIPWSFVQNDGTGTFTGAEAEIVKHCAEGFGITDIQPIAVQFDGLLPGLQADRWDVVAAGMSLRDERLEVAIATQQMYGFGVKALVPEGNPDGIQSWSDIAEAGLTVGMVSGGNYQDAVEELGIEVRPYDSLEAQIADLQAGRLDVVSNAELSLVDFVDKNPGGGVELADPWDYEGIGASMPALYFNSDNVGVRDAFNDCVSEMKEDGTLAAILEEWGFDPNSITPVAPGEPQS